MVTSGCLFRGVWVFCVRCQTFYSFYFPYYFCSGTHQSSLMGTLLLTSHQDQCPWMLVDFHVCVSFSSFRWGTVVLVHYAVCVTHDVCIVMGSSSMFLFLVSFFLVYDNRRRDFIIILSQHPWFKSSYLMSQDCTEVNFYGIAARYVVMVVNEKIFIGISLYFI